jgi:hypothetical protein
VQTDLFGPIDEKTGAKAFLRGSRELISTGAESSNSECAIRETQNYFAHRKRRQIYGAHFIEAPDKLLFISLKVGKAILLCWETSAE